MIVALFIPPEESSVYNSWLHQLASASSLYIYENLVV